MQTYVVSAQTPQAGKLAAWGYTVSEWSGVYVSTASLLHKIVLLVLNELRVAPHNEYVQLFASRQRMRRRALDSLGQVQPTALWTVILALQKAYELEGANMSTEVTLESLLVLGEEMRKKIVASASLDERLEGLAPQERLAGLAPEELGQLLMQNEQLRKEIVAHTPPEERLAGLSQQELLVLLKQIEAYLQGQPPAPNSPPATMNQ